MPKSKFLFISLTSIITGLLIAAVVMAWTNPSGNPTTGSGVLYYSGGNVGIGTTTPSYKLDVAGSLNITGSYLVNGAALSVGDNLNAKTVCSSGCDYTTIQAAMNAASAGDVILVAPGTYNEAVTFTQDNITLKATGNYNNTTITQASVTTVNFGTKEGNVLEGFTLSLTGAGDPGNGFVIAGANDTTNNTPNIIRNCYIYRTGSATLHNTISITDGDWEFHHCYMKLIHSNSDMGTIFQISGGAIVKIWDSELYATEGTASTNGTITMMTSASTLYMFGSKLVQTGANVTANTPKAIWTTGAAHTVYLYNNYIESYNSSTGHNKALYIDGGSTVHSYNNTYNCYGTGTTEWANIVAGSTLNSWGDQIIDGALTNAGTYNAYDTNQEGIITNSKNSGARVDRGGVAIQTIPTGTDTKILYDTETYDIQNEFDIATNYRFTAKVAGYYLVSLQVRYSAYTVNAIYQALIKKNNVTTEYTQYTPGSTAAGNIPTATGVIYLAVNDYIEGWTYHNAGVDQNLTSNDHRSNVLTIAKIR